MNVLFAAIFIVCNAILLFLSPERFLPTLLGAAGKSGALCLSLLSTYAVWLGLMRLWEDSGVSRGVSRALKPFAKRLFRTNDEQTLSVVCMNLSVNLLGISGAATPYGIRAAKLLDKTADGEYASCMFFVLSATSLQILPTSVIGVRTALGSAAPADVVLPTMLVSLFSTLLAAVLVRLFIPPKAQKVSARTVGIFQKSKGAGIG